MENRIEEYTVGELAQAAGVTVRMLHHYDSLELLKPAFVTAKGYRIYRQPELLRLQEILFYRAANMPLNEIAELLGTGNRVERLTSHREKVAKALSEQAAIIATLDRTIAKLNGDDPMTIEDLYKPFPKEKQADYEAWLVATYGQDMAAEIARSRENLSAGKGDILNSQNEQLKGIEAELVTSYEAGCDPKLANLAAHQNWVAEMWGYPCTAAAYAKLAELYLAHPDFIARYETLSEGFSQWLAQAMTLWAERHK
ncbi:transcriptional regulator, MerR family [Aliiroseovarius halocynthiae]|uniref:MerR family transcriptional regulator n=1 Tax=Aliiroseovarius halocynthiae TaxID=985055 RepID=A0A545SQH3_9RHOB|nr:MerR family transcriptional regulator [Aliiroseovarius halocynthiae]TQV67136.1 MerR family transcriptional regulator [Aliiroseovarius halocynthiae]SMR82135.1 transcriptional regulator, MerR family [Aliiroseovarius halocynthiae]